MPSRPSGNDNAYIATPAMVITSSKIDAGPRALGMKMGRNRTVTDASSHRVPRLNFVVDFIDCPYLLDPDDQTFVPTRFKKSTPSKNIAPGDRGRWPRRRSAAKADGRSPNLRIQRFLCVLRGRRS